MLIARFGRSGPTPSGASRWAYWPIAGEKYSDAGLTTLQTTNGGNVNGWKNIGGVGDSPIYVGGNHPTLDTSVTHLSQATVKFANAYPNFLQFGPQVGMGGGWDASVGSEIFVVLKASSNNDGVEHPVIKMGKESSPATPVGVYYPYSNGDVRSVFAGDHANAFTPAVSLTSQFRVYNERRKTNFCEVDLDGVNVFSDTSTGGAFFITNGTGRLGIDENAKQFQGWIAGAYVLVGILNASERAAALTFLSTGAGALPY